MSWGYLIMDKKIKGCKKCGKEIEKGKYCKSCEAEHKEIVKDRIKQGGGVIIGIATIAVAIMSNGKFGGNDKV